MQHVAIMKKSWGILPKIISGEKRIESRWYKAKCRPWDRIKRGEVVYFKNSGSPVTVKTKVRKVLQFDRLTANKVKKIINKYGGPDGIAIKELSKFYRLFKDKKYCILVFLEDPHMIKPFNIDKRGFGLMSAWVTTDNIDKIQIKC